MLPEFRFADGHWKVNETRIGYKCPCDCGKIATILACFAVEPICGGAYFTRDRKALGALVLCSDCAIEMWEMDQRAWRRNREADRAHFMGIQDAMRMAEETGRKKVTSVTVKGRWTKILAWMREQGGATVSEICQQFDLEKVRVGSQLYVLDKRGVVEVDRGKVNFYRVRV